MSQRSNHVVTGAFVLGAIALIVTGLVLFGSGKLFQPRLPMVMYFKEPVDGLDVGAPVRFNGVTVGAVTDIDLVWDLANNTFRTPVYADLLPDNLRYADATPEDVARLKGGKANARGSLIDRGLRAQLGLTSFLTGKLQVNLVMRPDTQPVFVSPEPAEIDEVPTIPSDIAQLKATFRNLMAKLNKLPLEGMIDNVDGTLEAIRRTLENPDINAGISEARALLADARTLVNSLDAQVAPLADSLLATSVSVNDAAGETARLMRDGRGTVQEARKALAEARTAIASADAMLVSANEVIAPGSPMQSEIIAALQQINSAARAVRSLADTLQQDPNSILFGRGRR